VELRRRNNNWGLGIIDCVSKRFPRHLQEATALEAEAILRQQAATAAEAERLKAMAAERARRGREDLDAANAAAQARKAAQREVDAAEDRAVLHAMEAKARLDA
jgi:hypothetical protein